VQAEMGASAPKAQSGSCHRGSKPRCWSKPMDRDRSLTARALWSIRSEPMACSRRMIRCAHGGPGGAGGQGADPFLQRGGARGVPGTAPVIGCRR
jgi:hypothetical protein